VDDDSLAGVRGGAQLQNVAHIRYQASLLFAMNTVFLDKVRRVLVRKSTSLYGRVFYNLDDVLAQITKRPFELHLELTNLCNANCVFCPYQFQERPTEFMSDPVFLKSVSDFLEIGGGSVGLTPIVGDPLIDPKLLERVRYLRSAPRIDRIFLTTNAILLDRFGIRAILESGVSSINISTSGFDEESYKRIYRSNSYQRMRRNVQQLYELNEEMGRPVNLCLCLRTDRDLSIVCKDPDFQPILRFQPTIDFTWSYSSSNGRITRDILPANMKLRHVASRSEPCVNLYHGPMVLVDGVVLGCSCLGAMDAVKDLLIGDIKSESLLDIYTGQLLRDLRSQFSTPGGLNSTCAGCDSYRNLDLLRTPEGRHRADLNRRRGEGEVVKREKAQGAFAGG
jgi:hypothetical protein